MFFCLPIGLYSHCPRLFPPHPFYSTVGPYAHPPSSTLLDCCLRVFRTTAHNELVRDRGDWGVIWRSSRGDTLTRSYQPVSTRSARANKIVDWGRALLLRRRIERRSSIASLPQYIFAAPAPRGQRVGAMQYFYAAVLGPRTIVAPTEEFCHRVRVHQETALAATLPLHKERPT